MAGGFLPGVDLGAEWLRGVSVAQQAVAERDRIQEAQARTALEGQLRSEQIAREQQLQQARLQTTAAYRQNVLELQKQRLDEVATVNAARLRETALKAADQAGFNQDLASGMPIEQAYYRHPRATTTQAIAAHKDTLDAAGEHLRLAQDRLDLEKRRLEDQENRKPKGATMADLKDAMATEKDTAGGRVPDQTKMDAIRQKMMDIALPPGTAFFNPQVKQTTQAGVPGGGQLQTGDVYKGYKFKGGDPKDQNNWEQL